MRDLLIRMKSNPRADWTLADVERLCRVEGIGCEPPRGGGSHFKVAHGSQPRILTIPFRKPVKPVYIRELIHFVEAVRRERDQA